MKRSMAGGAYRGPVAHGRQRRTIRFMQVLFALIAAGLIGYAVAVLAAPDEEVIGGRHDAGLAQPVVMFILAALAAAAAAALGGRSGVKIPTPARLEELVGRAETAALERAEQIAGDSRDAGGPAEPPPKSPSDEALGPR